MRRIAMMAAFSLLMASAWTAVADEPVRVNDIKGNVKARLTGAKRSPGRAANLVARFETIDKAQREIVVVFPAHSFTTHEATLKAIILSTSDWGENADHSKWGKVRSEVIFSVPEKGAHFSGGGGQGAKTLDHCYLVSLKLEAK